jgi:hypothetical protein
MVSLVLYRGNQNPSIEGQTLTTAKRERTKGQTVPLDIMFIVSVGLVRNISLLSYL